MKCVKCGTDLPDAAKFCPACGSRQDVEPKPAAAPPAAAPPVAAPPVAAPPVAAPPVAAPPVAAPPVAAPPASSPKADKQDPGQFALGPEDLARAVGFACTRAHVETNNAKPNDLNDFYAIGQKLGIDRKDLEASLHSVALEKMQGVSMGDTGRGAAAEIFRVHTVDSIPLPDLTTKKEKSKALVLALVAFILLAVGIIFAVLYMDWVAGKKERDAKAAAAAEAAMNKAPPPAPKGVIDIDAFRKSVEEVNGKVKACCDAELKQAITETTKVKVSIRIDLNGKASNIKLVKDPLQNKVVRGCIEKEVAANKFVAPTGAPVDIDFSLVFEPAKKKSKKRRRRKKRRKR